MSNDADRTTTEQDIVSVLRKRAESAKAEAQATDSFGFVNIYMAEANAWDRAANEIERLRGALQRVVDDIGHDWMNGRETNVPVLKKRVLEALRGTGKQP